MLIFTRHLAATVSVACLIATQVRATEPTGTVPLPAEQPLTAEQQEVLHKAQAVRIAAINKVLPTVVCVFGNDRAGGGSGVLIDPSGLTLTNHHVVAAAGAEGWGGLSDGKLYRWKLIGTDPGGDIAMIQLQRKEPFAVAPIGDSDALRVGDWALVMGNPFALADNYQPTVTMGIISGLKRYQPGGGGKNQLIYGNCIQVDASINPGNSGGPLFSMQSQLVGINGRGSFKERGRVNVGLGYAVSMRQILNFIPDLLATKIALHGTIDALFSNRGGRVVCSTIDLDSAAASAGLDLGDEMVSFDGQPITDANDFTNLVTTLPAGWPVRLVCRRAGREFSIDVPLSPLPYSLKPPKEDEEKPARSEEETSIAAISRPIDSPNTNELLQAPPRPGAPGGISWSLADAGKINEPALCQANAKRVLDRLEKSAGPRPSDVVAIRSKDAITREDKDLGRQECLFAADGRFRVDSTVDDKAESFGFDGKEFWAANQGAAGEVMEFAKWIEAPLRMQAFAIAASAQTKMLTSRGPAIIDGGDRISDRRAYRLRLAGEKDKSLFAWVSLDYEGDLTRHRLLAVGNTPAPTDRGSRIIFSDHRSDSGVCLPWRRVIVTGGNRRPDLVVTTLSCQGEKTLADDAFRMPKHEQK